MQGFTKVDREYIKDSLEKYAIMISDIRSNLIEKGLKAFNDKRVQEKSWWFFNKKPLTFREFNYNRTSWHSLGEYFFIYDFLSKQEADVVDMLDYNNVPKIGALLSLGNADIRLGDKLCMFLMNINSVFEEYSNYQKEQSRALAELIFNEVTEEDTGDIV
jgi:hypothetical protein